MSSKRSEEPKGRRWNRPRGVECHDVPIIMALMELMVFRVFICIDSYLEVLENCEGQNEDSFSYTMV